MSANGPSASPLAGVRVAVVNDLELVIAGVEAMLNPHADRITVCPSITVDSPAGPPIDVVLFDAFSREGRDPAVLNPVLGQLLSRDDVRRVAVYTADLRREMADAALAAGAAGFLSKAAPARQLVDQIERIAAGKVVVDPPAPLDTTSGQARSWPGKHAGLSVRESEIVALVSLGRRNSEIAEALFISVETVKTHLSHAFRKLGLSNRTQVASFVLRDETFRGARKRGTSP